MQQGSIKSIGETNEVINAYLSSNRNGSLKQVYPDPATAAGNEKVKLKRIEIVPSGISPEEPIRVDTPIDIEFEFWNRAGAIPINVSMHLYTIGGECVFNAASASLQLSEGLHKAVCHIPPDLLNDGIYTVSMMVVGESSYALFNFEDLVSFEVTENRQESGWHGKWPGLIRPKLNFTLE